MTRGRKPTAAGAELASSVLSDLAAGMSHAAIAERHGVSRQRVGAIAKAAGVTTRASRGGTGAHRGAALLARLRELAAAYGEDPADWLEDAARCRTACEEIVVAIDHSIAFREDLDLDSLRCLAIGPTDRALAAQVRGAVDAADECAGPSAIAELAIKLVDLLDS